MAIQQWTMEQWRLVYEMIHSTNKWSLIRFVDGSNDDQIDVDLHIFGPLELLEPYKIFGGHINTRYLDWVPKKVEREPYDWILRGEELDNFLDNLWILLSRDDPYRRLTDVRQAQDIRRRVREGCSYPFYHPKAAKRP